MNPKAGQFTLNLGELLLCRFHAGQRNQPLGRGIEDVLWQLPREHIDLSVEQYPHRFELKSGAGIASQAFVEFLLGPL